MGAKIKIFAGIFFLLLSLLLVFNFNKVAAYSHSKFQQYLTVSLCDKPIAYKIGFIDSRFNVTKDQFAQDIEDSAQIWDETYQKNELFIRSEDDPKALTINLVYDKRSSLNSEINSLHDEVSKKDKSLQDKIDAYEVRAADFKKRLAEFDAKADELEKQIRYWNEKGGAPEDEYKKLTEAQDNLLKEQDSLNAEAQELNQVAASLNLSTQDYNKDVKKLNQTIDQFDKALDQKPEEGLFDGTQNLINIYFVNNHEELIHTLTHELGHSLGIYHNQNTNSIMYPYSTKNITPTKEDIAGLQGVCSTRYFYVPVVSDFLSRYR